MQNTKRLAIGAMFLSIMLVIGYIEYQIPTGVPGIQLGLSNSVLLLSLYWLGIPFSLGLMLSRFYSAVFYSATQCHDIQLNGRHSFNAGYDGYIYL